MKKRFIEGLQEDIKFMAYFTLLFFIARIAFIFFYQQQLNDTSMPYLGEALLLGTRLSLKTVGAFVVPIFVFATLCKTFLPSWPAQKLRKWWGMALAFLVSFLFFVRLPYYAIFNSAFNIMLINGFYDDKGAILDTAIREYGLLWRLPIAILVSALVSYSYKRWMKIGGISYEKIKKPVLVVGLSIVLIPVLAIFIRYGGAFSYANSVAWENAQRLPSTLLNEAILDDFQALYRVRSSYKRIKASEKMVITEEQLKAAITTLGGDPTKPIDQAFNRVVKEQKLGVQPKQVVFILGESYGSWPFLEDFKAADIVPQGLALANSPQAITTKYMIPNGSGTMPTINSFVTGLPFNDLYENYRPETFKAPYALGMGNVMKKLGYKTIFWYGGFESWQNIKNFVLAQGFDEFRGANHFSYKKGNAWGADDSELFQAVADYIKGTDGNEKVFHIIMTTSNHPPYSVNLEEAGFPKDKILSQLPESISRTEQSIKEVGHMWYADKVMGEFIHAIEKLSPEALFVITGDHSQRFTFAKEVDVPTIASVPGIIYGKGVKKEWIPPQQVGIHAQLLPTVVELIAPVGTHYVSLYPSLFIEPSKVYNFAFWGEMGEMYSNKSTPPPTDVKDKLKASEILTVARVLKQ